MVPYHELLAERKADVNLVPRVFAIFKTADGGEDPGRRCKTVHESRSFCLMTHT